MALKAEVLDDYFVIYDDENPECYIESQDIINLEKSR